MRRTELVAKKAKQAWDAFTLGTFLLAVVDDDGRRCCFKADGELKIQHEMPTKIKFDISLYVVWDGEATENDLKVMYKRFAGMTKIEMETELEREKTKTIVEDFGFLGSYDDDDPALPELRDDEPLPHVVGDWTITGHKKMMDACALKMHPRFATSKLEVAFRRKSDGKLVASRFDVYGISNQPYHQGVLDEFQSRNFSGYTLYTCDVDAKSAFLEIEAAQNRTNDDGDTNLISDVLNAFM